MALPADCVFEYRPDGPALGLGAGGYSASVGGVGSVDFSQQLLPVLNVADAVGTSTTTISSATGGFTGQMKGNLVVVNVNCYIITTVTDANHIVVDRATGTFSGQRLVVGGAFACKGTATSALEPIFYGVNVPGQYHYFKNRNAAGALTPYAPAAGPHCNAVGLEWNLTSYEGYGLVRGDGGIADFGAGGTGAMVAQGAFTSLKNLQYRGTFGGVTLSIGAIGQVVENVIADASAAGGYAVQNVGAICRRCWFKGPTSGGGTTLREVGGGGSYEECRFDATTNTNVSIESGTLTQFRNCLINGGTAGLQLNNNTARVGIQNCAIWNSSGPGLDFPVASLHDGEGTLVQNTIFGKNAIDIAHHNFAVVGQGGQAWVNAVFRCNQFFTTGTRYFQMPAASDDITLTANPFTNDAIGDFTLNNLAGGGAVVRATLCTYGWPDGINSTVLGAGPQGVLAAVVPTATATMMNLWRELTNERFTPGDPNSAIPDATVQIYLDFGLQALNREAHYHFSDGVITLVAGQQEYALPGDFILAQFLQFSNFRRLERSSVDRWLSDNDDWRNEPPGQPRFWAVYANKLVVRPTPDAAAVAAAPNLTLRYCSTPPPISGPTGPEQLGSQEYRLAVLYGVLIFSTMYPESMVAQQRISEVQKQWDMSLPKVIQEYAQRQISS